MVETFKHLPASSRVWIYQSDRAFSAAEAESINAAISEFVAQWLSHKAKVIGDGRLLYDRFVVLVADEEKLQLGGCSIDSTVRFIKDLGTKYNVNFFDRFFTCYWDNGRIESSDFETFKTKLAQGLISEDTIVFNNLVRTIDGLNTQWQLPLSKSWHSKSLTMDTSLKL